MTTSNLSYNQFLYTVEESDNINCIEKIGYISQIKRKGSNISIYSADSIASSTYSTTSIKFATPSATNIYTALYQKGFEIRQFDSDKEFDLVIEQGFQGSVGECMPTLKLTLTPNLIRR